MRALFGLRLQVREYPQKGPHNRIGFGRRKLGVRNPDDRVVSPLEAAAGQLDLGALVAVDVVALAAEVEHVVDVASDHLDADVVFGALVVAGAASLDDLVGDVEEPRKAAARAGNLGVGVGRVADDHERVDELVHGVVQRVDGRLDAPVVAQILLGALDAAALPQNLARAQDEHARQLALEGRQTLAGVVLDAVLGVELLLTVGPHFVEVLGQVDVAAAEDHERGDARVEDLFVAALVRRARQVFGARFGVGCIAVADWDSEQADDGCSGDRGTLVSRVLAWRLLAD